MNSLWNISSASIVLHALLLTIPLLFTCLLYCQPLANNEILKIGDPAPPLHLGQWIKGKPIDSLENGKIHVVEFWATWCAPCIKAMPRFGKTVKKYRKSVTALSVNVWESKYSPKERARAIVDSFGRRLNYSIAFDDSGRTANAWLDRTWDAAVPIAYVIDKDGRITWIGHTDLLDTVLRKVTAGTWDRNSTANRYNFAYEANRKDFALREEVIRFHRSGNYSDYVGDPDSTLYYVDSITTLHPEVKYAYNATYHKFTALLKTDMKKALAFAKQAVKPDNPLGAEYWAIIQGIQYISNYFSLSPEIYALGGELMEKYGGSIAANLIKASEWYWLGGKKEDAMRCLKKGRKAVKKAKHNGYGTFF